MTRDKEKRRVNGPTGDYFIRMIRSHKRITKWFEARSQP